MRGKATLGCLLRYIGRMSIQVFGVPVSRGVAIGRAVLVASSRVDVAH